LNSPCRRSTPSLGHLHKKKGLPLRRILLKVTLFLVIFSFSFYLPNQVTEIKKREKTIQEIVSVLQSRQTDLSNVVKEDLAEAIYEEAIRYNHDPKFILALMDTESNFYNWLSPRQEPRV